MTPRPYFDVVLGADWRHSAMCDRPQTDIVRPLTHDILLVVDHFTSDLTQAFRSIHVRLAFGTMTG